MEVKDPAIIIAEASKTCPITVLSLPVERIPCRGDLTWQPCPMSQPEGPAMPLVQTPQGGGGREGDRDQQEV